LSVPLSINDGCLFVMLLNGFGDAFLALPALRALVRCFPGRVCLACHGTQINTVFRGLDATFVPAAYDRGVWSIGDEIPIGQIAAVVSFNAYYPDPVERGLSNAVRGSRRWGFCDLSGKPLLQNASRHMRDQYFDVLGWETSYAIQEREIALSPSARTEVRNFLFTREIRHGAFYALHLDSTAEKMWDIANWAVVIGTLKKSYGLRPVILGNETADSELLLKKFDFAVKLPSSLGIDRHFALLEQVDLFLGIDSIFAHVADSLNKVTVVLFGPSDPVIWGPVNAKSHVIQSLVDQTMSGIRLEPVLRATRGLVADLLRANSKGRNVVHRHGGKY